MTSTAPAKQNWHGSTRSWRSNARRTKRKPQPWPSCNASAQSTVLSSTSNSSSTGGQNSASRRSALQTTTIPNLRPLPPSLSMPAYKPSRPTSPTSSPVPSPPSKKNTTAPSTPSANTLLNPASQNPPTE